MLGDMTIAIRTSASRNPIRTRGEFSRVPSNHTREMMDDNDEIVVIPQYVYLVKILSAVNSTAAGVVYRGRIVDLSQSDTEGNRPRLG
jgi:hypothetical protein